MPAVKCHGVNIDFPFEPYDCQKDYMGKVIECLQKGVNGILESPTGTGKTLCLLCSTLAWRHTFIAQQELGRAMNKDELPQDAESANYRQTLMSELNQGASGWGQVSEEGRFIERPKIIYASRTHSQLTQAIAQLKDTSYRPRVSVLGSREQMCVHPEITKAESNAAKVHMCRAKVTSRLCHFYNNLDHKKGEKELTDQILDVEDLVTAGKKHKFCPYYMARELKTSADIVFMPYNYLLDPKARKIHGVELQGNIIIFDEAHNVEKMCEESASFDLTSFDIASCIEVVGQLLERTTEVNTLNEQFNGVEDFNSLDVEDLAVLKRLFMLLEKSIIQLNIPKEGFTKPASFIFDLFNKVNITMETKDELLKLLGDIVTHLTSDTGAFHRAAGLQKFSEVIQIVYSSDLFGGSNNFLSEATKYYKVHLKEVELKKNPAGASNTLDAWIDTSAPGRQKGYVLSYWCFSPGFTMQELVSQGVRSIILTSGTLSPLASFKSELKINFPVQLENPHVIKKHQMVVGIVTKGPDRRQLDSSYKNRSNLHYISSLGNAIVNFARIVPNGLLVFFPSYTVMNICLEHWQENKVCSRISQYKAIVIEPRGKSDFSEAMEAFYSQVKDPTLNGATFFAVCRGKVSEGLDFADMNGRAVVITGLPFPPQMDPKVKLKMQYLDEIKRKCQVGLSGHEWYRQQASRAVNQAVGRVIRHKEDYGAILLCDWRFTHAEARKQLPAWVKPYVKVYEEFGQCVKDIIGFFKFAEKTLPQPIVKQPKVENKQDVFVSSDGASTSTAGVSVNQAINRASREVDSHVPSLKRNRDGSLVSQSQLMVMYEQSRSSTSKNAVNLLDALHQAEASSSSDNPSTTTSLHNSTSKVGDGKPENPFAKPDGVKKKRKIVVKPHPSNVTPSEERKKNHLNAAQLYILKIKKALQRDSYEMFSALLKGYRDGEDFSKVLTGLENLLLKKANHPDLFREFYRFIRSADKAKFDHHCLTVLGQGCGYKPEDSISRKQKETLQKDEGTQHTTGATTSASNNVNNLDNKTNLNGGM
ncbi:regulator of telomere elongation helicase 1-like isoform X2 [Apostichopus japonicus]|uniref:regulator of telomere elongation helicase 1-like isoform X2 n=1 Tax=Stichopus japonicus TaxID=307972 RepID=UPI003AB70569